MKNKAADANNVPPLPCSSETQSESSSSSDAHASASSAAGGGGLTCPVKHSSVKYNVYSQALDPKNNMPVHANNLPSANQTSALSTVRVSSTILKGGGGGGGSADDKETWTYPSPQMFWNSINRKKKVGDTTEGDIDIVVAIHNNMNETTWKKVVEWEAVRTSAMSLSPSSQPSEAPKLLKFLGRPMDLSPKARLKSLFGYPLPFDRHDWVVERPSGASVRYVIDYYHDDRRSITVDPKTGLPSMHDPTAVQSILVDVRPSCDDGPSALFLRGFAMPLYRILGWTNFAPLPFMPTADLRAQRGESQKTWEGIIASASATSDPTPEQLPPLSSSDMSKLSANLASIKKDCAKAQDAVSKCASDVDCAKKALSLQLCMAKVACLLQHDAVKAAVGDKNAGEKVDVALKNMVACVERFDDKVLQMKQQQKEAQ